MILYIKFYLTDCYELKKNHDQVNHILLVLSLILKSKLIMFASVSLCDTHNILKKLLLVIPVYNEQETIGKVLLDWSKILAKEDFDILVINDGSSDNTLVILQDIKNKISNLIILDKPNQGHGKAIIDGYRYAILNNYQMVFQTDSDDQFLSGDFIKLWNAKNKNSNFELILGERKQRNDPILRVILSKVILRLILTFLFGKFLADPNIPYRLISIKFLKKFIEIQPDDFIAPNIIMSLFSKKIQFIEVRHLNRKYGQVNWSIIKLSKFSFRLIRDLFYFWLNLKKFKNAQN